MIGGWTDGQSEVQSRCSWFSGHIKERKKKKEREHQKTIKISLYLDKMFVFCSMGDMKKYF